MGKTIIMGRKTFESIGAALTGRRNIVISKDHTLNIENVEIVQEIDQLIKQFAHSDEECFVFGGQLIFEEFLPYVQKIYLTYIDHSFIGDRFFPVIDELEWDLVEKVIGEDVNIPFEYTFLTLKRRIKNV
jgi:dihydrofolate reductase